MKRYSWLTIGVISVGNRSQSLIFVFPTMTPLSTWAGVEWIFANTNAAHMDGLQWLFKTATSSDVMSFAIAMMQRAQSLLLLGTTCSLSTTIAITYSTVNAGVARKTNVCTCDMRSCLSPAAWELCCIILFVVTHIPPSLAMKLKSLSYMNMSRRLSKPSVLHLQRIKSRIHLVVRTLEAMAFTYKERTSSVRGDNRFRVVTLRPRREGPDGQCWRRGGRHRHDLRRER